MIIRIRFGGPRTTGERVRRRSALVAASLLTPASVMALALACWDIAAELNWTGSFAIPSGPFSHWQVWLAAAALLQVCSRYLFRYARKGA